MAGTVKKTKIMIVEDDPMLLDMYVHKFEGDGYEVVKLDRGDAVAETASTEQPELILLDVIMPGIDGFTALEALKKNAKTKDIPVTMLTNLAQDEDSAKAKEMGAVGYIIKSNMTPAEVVKQAQQLLKS